MSAVSPASTTPAAGDSPDEPEGNVFARTVRRLRSKVREARRTRAATKSRSSGPIVIVLIVTLLALFAAFGYALSYVKSPSASGRQVSLSQLAGLARDGRITKATFLDEDNVIAADVVPALVVPPKKTKPAKGQTPTAAKASPAPAAGATPVASAAPSASPTASPVASASPGAKAAAPATSTTSDVIPASVTRVIAHYPQQGTLTQALENRLEASGAQVTVDSQATKQRVKLILQFLLPVLILANVFALLLTAGRGSQGSIGGVVSFGSLDSSRRGDSATTFNDVGGADEAVAELAEVRDYLTNPAKYEALGAAPPKGVMLFGPPGTGKTLLAKAVAGEAGVPFFSVAGAQFVESLVGVGAARVRDLFKRVRAVAPAILFIDEIDAVGRRRGAGGGSGGSDEREQTLNQLLVEMDGFDVSTGVVVIAATNRPDILDPALMRPGRFDRHVTVERPDAEGREIILAIHARNKPLSAGVDLANLAHRTPGFTGADLASVVNEAALLTIRAGNNTITNSEFDEAIDRVLSGPRRRGRILSEEETRRAALHETGHAVVAAALGHAEDVSRVSVLPRGRSVAATTLHPDDAVLTRSQLLVKLTTLMGGAAAERLVYGETSTGVEDDLDEATDLARDIAARYGMSRDLGPVRLLARQGNAFLGDVPPIGDLSPATREALDAEIANLIESAEKRAYDLLVVHEGALHTIADNLQEHETIEGDPLQKLLLLVTESASGRRSARAVATKERPAKSAAKAAPKVSAQAPAKPAAKTPAARTTRPGAK